MPPCHAFVAWGQLAMAWASSNMHACEESVRMKDNATALPATARCQAAVAGVATRGSGAGCGLCDAPSTAWHGMGPDGACGPCKCCREVRRQTSGTLLYTHALANFSTEARPAPLRWVKNSQSVKQAGPPPCKCASWPLDSEMMAPGQAHLRCVVWCGFKWAARAWQAAIPFLKHLPARCRMRLI